ncbi:unnamed protein product [Albugo candida]|uniref:Uncharacterized protein n=1 Tax=Albugo candida TaxID=65357 RepID=A0A024GF10_9STRA|nr:unnamed protein product [Albugo candida]|eukprot:CCI44892.1 unnamed protein product [Albugo candida]
MDPVKEAEWKLSVIDIGQPRDAVHQIMSLLDALDRSNTAVPKGFADDVVIRIMKENYRLDLLTVAKLVECLKRYGAVPHRVLEEQAVHSIRNLPRGVPISILLDIMKNVHFNGGNYNSAREAKVIYFFENCPSDTSEETIKRSLSSVTHNGVLSGKVQDAVAICRLRSLQPGAGNSEIEKIVNKVKHDGVVSHSVLEQEAIYRLNNLPSDTPFPTIVEILVNMEKRGVNFDQSYEDAINIIENLPARVPISIVSELVEHSAERRFNERIRNAETRYKWKYCPPDTSKQQIEHYLDSKKQKGCVLSRGLQDAVAICRLRILQPGAGNSEIEKIVKEVTNNGVVSHSVLEQEAIYRLNNLPSGTPFPTIYNILVNAEKRGVNFDPNSEQAIRIIQNLPPHLPAWISMRLVKYVSSKFDDEYEKRARVAEICYELRYCSPHTSEEKIQKYLESVEEKNGGVLSREAQDAAAICRLRSLRTGADDSEIRNILKEVTNNGVVSHSVLEQEAIYRLDNLPSGTPLSTIMKILTNVYYYANLYKELGLQAIHIVQNLPPDVPSRIVKMILKIAKDQPDYEKRAREEEVIYVLKKCPSTTPYDTIQWMLKFVTYGDFISRSVRDAGAIFRLRCVPQNTERSEIDKILKAVKHNDAISPSVLKQEALHRLLGHSSGSTYDLMKILQDVEKYAISEKQQHEEEIEQRVKNPSWNILENVNAKEIKRSSSL